MALPRVSAEMRVVADPELRFTPSGAAVCEVRLVSNKRKLNKQTDEWEDANVCWLKGVAWRQLAENIAESVQKGDLVVVSGDLETQEWEADDGSKRQTYQIMIDSIGPALRWATAKVSRAQRSEGGSQQRSGGQQQSGGDGDPWGRPPAPSDEPPF